MSVGGDTLAQNTPMSGASGASQQGRAIGQAIVAVAGVAVGLVLGLVLAVYFGWIALVC
jgi:high-affinity Fe2+/Pb2+ permease